MSKDLQEIIGGLFGILLVLAVVVATVATIRYAWNDNWKLPAPFKSASNEEIIRETKKCEEAGLRAYMRGSLFHDGGIGCTPKSEQL